MYFIKDWKFNSDFDYNNKNDLIFSLNMSDGTTQEIHMRDVHLALKNMGIFDKSYTLKDIEERYFEEFESDRSSYFVLLSFNWVAGQASTSLIWNAKKKKFSWAGDDLFHPIGMLGFPFHFLSEIFNNNHSGLFVVYDSWWNYTLPATNNLKTIHIQNDTVKIYETPLYEFNTVPLKPGSTEGVKKVPSGGNGLQIYEDPKTIKDCQLIKEGLHCHFYQDTNNNFYIVNAKNYFKFTLDNLFEIVD